MSTLIVSGVAHDLSPLGLEVSVIVDRVARRIARSIHTGNEAARRDEAIAIARAELLNMRRDLPMADVLRCGDVLGEKAIERARASTSTEKAARS